MILISYYEYFIGMKKIMLLPPCPMDAYVYSHEEMDACHQVFLKYMQTITYTFELKSEHIKLISSKMINIHTSINM